MLTLYFSGTGNTKYIAEGFSKRMKGECRSITEDADFKALLQGHSRICICYPVYMSRMPLVVKDFVQQYGKGFKGKEVSIIAVQAMFSGDGARAFVDLFPKGYFRVIYARHITMPNNICSFPVPPIKNGDANRSIIKRANAALSKMCGNIKRGKIVRQGFNPVSKFLGTFQGAGAESLLTRGKSSVVVDEDCIACGICVKACPVHNLEMIDGQVSSKNNCAVCFRCVNACPKQAITTLINKKPKAQYRGPGNLSTSKGRVSKNADVCQQKPTQPV